MSWTPASSRLGWSRGAKLFRPPRLDELRERPAPPDLSAQAVAARLQELRALLRLSAYLGQARIAD